MPSVLDAVVDSTRNAINLCMKEALVPALLHRRLVPFWDNELKKKKNKARTRGDISTYKTSPLLWFLLQSYTTTLASKPR
jgi:hypothetical protein